MSSAVRAAMAALRRNPGALAMVAISSGSRPFSGEVQHGPATSDRFFDAAAAVGSSRGGGFLWFPGGVANSSLNALNLDGIVVTKGTLPGNVVLSSALKELSAKIDAYLAAADATALKAAEAALKKSLQEGERKITPKKLQVPRSFLNTWKMPLWLVYERIYQHVRVRVLRATFGKTKYQIFLLIPKGLDAGYKTGKEYYAFILTVVGWYSIGLSISEMWEYVQMLNEQKSEELKGRLKAFRDTKEEQLKADEASKRAAAAKAEDERIAKLKKAEDERIATLEAERLLKKKAEDERIAKVEAERKKAEDERIAKVEAERKKEEEDKEAARLANLPAWKRNTLWLRNW